MVKKSKSPRASSNSNPQVVRDLVQFLSDTYVLYVKTQNFHWNVVDPRFFSLHKMLEEQYEDLAEATDEIAERLRALEQKAPGSMKEFLKNSSLEEANKNHYSANEMIQELTQDHQAISKSLLKKIKEATSCHDEGTADLFIERLRVHDKTAWMLRSHFTSHLP